MAFRPKRAFRIADRRHTIFDGTGAFLKGARWNSPGRRIIYAAENFPGALLETLVHLGTGHIPRRQSWIEIKFPPGVTYDEVKPGELADWNDSESVSARETGDEWHERKKTLLLLVPSLPALGLSRNILINQDHPDFPTLSASDPREVVWDSRLFER